jgi:hypothetical protein
VNKQLNLALLHWMVTECWLSPKCLMEYPSLATPAGSVSHEYGVEIQSETDRIATSRTAVRLLKYSSYSAFVGSFGLSE